MNFKIKFSPPIEIKHWKKENVPDSRGPKQRLLGIARYFSYHYANVCNANYGHKKSAAMTFPQSRYLSSQDNAEVSW